ncbi:ComE operon protein 3 [Methanocorpusculaceae archaeon Ag1]|uniref:ComE operon protein 3 n=2 Tax=Methanorbis furvi TaxID=3028299 RepID=A0AAE4MBP0_9EURY|nr:ComE operon protein 3 [Methanocorpusculaceae archaeon Ag1]
MAAKKSGRTSSSHKKKSKNMSKQIAAAVVVIAAAVCVVIFGGGMISPASSPLAPLITDEHAFSMHVIDVGQADAILLSKDGKFALVDAGETMKPSEREARDKLFAYLDSLNVTRLEFLLLTHQDYDHIGSALDVLKKYDVGTVYDNGVVHTSATYEKLMTHILDQKIPYRVVAAGDVISSPWQGVTLEVLSPQKDLIMSGKNPDINENSVVIKAVYQNVSYLLTGDAEKKAEEAMFAAGEDLNADILKAGHHGSSTSSTQKFLNAVSPAVIVISLGEGNEYGHPHKEPLERFVQMTKHIYRTDMDGDIVVTTDGNVYSVVTRKAHVYENVIVPNQAAA